MSDKLQQLLGGVGDLYPAKTAEKFPRIVEKIGILWGTVGMSRYFSEILFDERGDREGFPPEVMAELFALSNYHESAKPSRSALQNSWHDGKDIDRLERFKKT